jgi:hypothetical protein
LTFRQTAKRAFNYAFRMPMQLAKAVRGLLQFLLRGEADHASWLAMLYLHCQTNGRWTDALTGIMRRLSPPPAPLRAFDSKLGHFEVKDVEAVAAQLRRDGYYIFDGVMPEKLCDAFAEATRGIEARTSRDPNNPSPRAKFDPANPIGYVYDLPEEEIWKLRTGQEIIADPVFLNVAQAYFRATPTLKNLDVWWSAVMDGKPDSNSAQMFHYDYDAAPIWLKFFVYMTDVTTHTGPHVFVKGSHRMQQPRMRELLSRGYVRISDEEIVQIFGAENVIEHTGRKGTVIAVDTLGYHKGKPPESGSRLVAQLEFATPLFAKSVSEPVTIPAELEPALAKTIQTYPWAFQRYRRSGAAAGKGS